jgi:hypothetical protein
MYLSPSGALDLLERESARNISNVGDESLKQVQDVIVSIYAERFPALVTGIQKIQDGLVEAQG